MHNECSILKDAVITAIPSHCSKVMFKTCSKVKSTDLQNNVNGNCDEMMLTNISDEKMGFIMMECGFEGISFKVSIVNSSVNSIQYLYVGFHFSRLLKDQTLRKKMIERLEMYQHLHQYPNLLLEKYHTLKFVLKMKIF